MFELSVTGKLAEDGTGDGVYERRSAKDLAARRLLCAPKPLGESGMPRKPEDCWPLRVLVVYIPGSEPLASLKSIVAALFSPRRDASPPWTVGPCGSGGLMLLPGGAR